MSVCPYCEAHLALNYSETKTCEVCHAEIPIDAFYCPYCGCGQPLPAKKPKKAKGIFPTFSTKEKTSLLTKRVKAVVALLVALNVVLAGFAFYQSYSFFTMERELIELAKSYSFRCFHPNGHEHMFLAVSGSVVEVMQEATSGWETGSLEELKSDAKLAFEWLLENIAFRPDCTYPVYVEGEGLLLVSDYWQFPNETISYKSGDYEDLAVLFSCIVRSYVATASNASVDVVTGVAVLWDKTRGAHPISFVLVEDGDQKNVMYFDFVTKEYGNSDNSSLPELLEVSECASRLRGIYAKNKGNPGVLFGFTDEGVEVFEYEGELERWLSQL